MMIPVRCISCGRPLAGLWEKYMEHCKTKSPKQALDSLNIKSPCCRTLFLTHIDMIDEIAEFRI